VMVNRAFANRGDRDVDTDHVGLFAKTGLMTFKARRLLQPCSSATCELTMRW
jgi:hypothetical protein